MKSTEMIRRINRAATPQEAWGLVSEPDRLPALSGYLSAEVRAAGITVSELSTRTNVERTALYHIMEGKRKASRNVLLRIALALRFTLEQTQTLLKHGRKSALTPRDRRDMLLIFCLQRQYELPAAEALLLKMKEASLYERA